MDEQNRNKHENELYKSLKVDCSKCFGFCCVALYFAASEGFPADKEAGKPCINLQQDFGCAVHKSLREKGLKGCTAYDCFGAGQKVAQITYDGHDWREHPQSAKQMFEAFAVMRQLHEMLWYLAEAFRIQAGSTQCNNTQCNNTQSNIILEEKLSQLIDETERLTKLKSEALLQLDIETHRQQVNILLQQTSEFIRSKAFKGQHAALKNKKRIAGRLNLIGANFKNANLRGADFRGALLIAANLKGADLKGADFIGADLRDTDFSGADLSKSLFLTPMQIHAAKGDSNTKLPPSIVRPAYWGK